MPERISAARLAGLLGTAALFAAALLIFLRIQSFSRYREARAEAKSLESALPSLEKNLQAAARFPGRAGAWGELGRVYLELALAEDQFGSASGREAYLDKARDALAEQIRRYPLDAMALYRAGMVYTLYSRPLMIYAERGWPFFIRALELSPSDEFININGLFILLSQWERLPGKEREFVRIRLRQIADRNLPFISGIGALWSKSFGSRDGLLGILAQDHGYWFQMGKVLESD